MNHAVSDDDAERAWCLAEVDIFCDLSDETGDVWKRFEITEQSHYVILDKNGETAYEGVLPGGEGLADKVAGLTG